MTLRRQKRRQKKETKRDKRDKRRQKGKKTPTISIQSIASECEIETLQTTIPQYIAPGGFGYQDPICEHLNLTLGALMESPASQ